MLKIFLFKSTKILLLFQLSSFVNLFTWSMLLDPRTSISAWLVVVVFWLYVAVVVGSCFIHWKHIYERVQLNKTKKGEKKKKYKEGSMIKSMCSIRALERQATLYSEMGSSAVPYKEFQESDLLRNVKRSKSLPSIQEEKKRTFECTTSVD